MTKLISGRVAKIPSANVSADRREFIDLAETEPDLGLPTVSGWVLSSDLTGNRSWIDPVQAAGGTPYFANTSLVSQFAYVANVSNTTLSLSNFTTANLVEGINLYFTNARVLANVEQMSINVLADVDITGIVPNGILTWDGSKFIAGTISAGAIANTSNFAYVANVANIVLTLDNFTTTNLKEGSNLYYTNARARTAFTAGTGIVIDWAAGTITANTGGIVAGLTTADVREVSANLYFTNARVIAALSNATITGNLTVTDTIFANTFTGANGGQPVIASIGSLTLSAGNNGNIVFTSNIIANQITANNLIVNGNASKITGNLTVTDTVFANTFTGANGGQPVIASIGTLTLSAGAGGNIVFTSNIIANKITANNLVINGNELFSGESGANLTVTQITANIWNGLYTANVIETTGNLYFTNARVVSALIAGQNIIIEANGRISANIAATTAQSLNLTTADVREVGSNLYYTNARVIAALSNATITGNLTVTDTIFANTFTGANGGQPVIASIGTLTLSAGAGGNIVFTSNIIANKITANNLVINGNELFSGEQGANLTVTQITANSWNGLYTSNVIESPTNLYYTNARARTAVTGGTGVAVDWSTGSISIGQNVATSSSVTFYNVSVTNNLTVYGGVETFAANNMVVSDNMIYLNNGSQNSNPDIGFAANYNDGVYHHTGFFRDATDGVWKVFENYLPEPDANIFIDTSHASFRVANIQATTLIGNITGTAGTLDNFTTTNLKEGSNLYYTNARARTAFTAGDSTIILDWEAGTIKANIVAASAASLALTTADVREVAGNLYYTNARVIAALSNATITGNLTVTDTIFANTFTGANGGQPVIASIGSLTLSAGNNGNIVFTSNIIANKITANNLVINGNELFSGESGANLTVTQITANIWNGLYTANVIESPSKLYFTVARVNATVQPFLTTANVVETSGNLYFTVARVNATVQPFLTTANVVETAGNLYFTNARVVSALSAGQNIVIASNGQISANVTSIATNLTTADVREVSSNLYYTNARVVAALSNATIVGNVTVTDTLFANGFSSASGGQPIISSIGSITLSAGINSNIIFTSNIIANKITANNLVINGNELFSGEQGANLTVTQITANSWNGLYTANVIESPSNLYYTNARARTAFTAADGSIIINWTTGTISANTGTVTGSILPFLTTANVSEASSNLYFTNARVIAALSNATISGNLTVTDTIFANTFTGANGGQPVIASIGSLTLSAGAGGNIVFTSNIIANKITANNLIINGNELFSGEQGANLTVTRIVANSWIGLYTANVIESPSNLYFTNARVLAALVTANVYVENLIANSAVFANAIFLGAVNVTSNILSGSGATFSGDVLTGSVTANIWNRLYTANVIETSGNLYYTNARARTAFTAGDSTIIINWAAGTITANVAATTANSLALTTADVREVSSNLYFTVNRVNATIQPFLTTANVVETSGNIYFTNARVLAALSNANIEGNLRISRNLYANGLIINGNEIFVTEQGANLTVTQVRSNSWVGLYTANVIESPTNLYFTNARARTAFTGGNGITIDSANGVISANTVSGISILNATQRIQSTGANTYTLNVPIATPQSILVIVEGLVQIPSVDYTVSGTTLTLSDYPILNSNIEVRYYGTDAIYQSSSIITKVDSFIGTGSTTYTLSLNPPSKDSVTVVVNGVYRQSDQYSINNKILTFNSAPAVGANVDIRTVSGIAGTAFNTRTYTATGTSNTFVITDGFTQDTILVFANGYARIPTIDYTVTDNIVTFTSNVLSINGTVIQIRELGVTGLAGGTTAASIRGYDLITGNVIPTTDATKNLGSSTYKWNDSYVNQSYVTNVLILGGTTVSTSGSSITLVSNGVTTTLSGPTQSSRAFGLALIFGG